MLFMLRASLIKPFSGKSRFFLKGKAQAEKGGQADALARGTFAGKVVSRHDGV